MDRNRIFRLFIPLACIGSSIPQLLMQANVMVAQTAITAECSQTTIPDRKLCVDAQKFTIKIFSKKAEDNYQASGILIDKQVQPQQSIQTYRYSVLTNAHVLKSLKKRDPKSTNNYQIQTFDGQVHSARIEEVDLGNNDLGLLHFSSKTNYQVSRIGE
jgi:hypothetical protein